jgi:hypothetical protein
MKIESVQIVNDLTMRVKKKISIYYSYSFVIISI